ncbi:MAG TPA: hypothetical protein VFC56_04340 [Stellaceae bacterium]|nr:hypothetical protein [Stellaceae bacterium]
MKFACRRLALFALPVFLLSAGSGFAADGTWVEPKFDPPVGSKWTVERELNIEKNEHGTLAGHTLKQTALLTIEEKTADGYVISYARQKSDYKGDPKGASLQRIAYAAQQGVVLRVATDASGRPLRVLNLDEMRATLRDAIAARPSVAANPEILASIKRVAERMVSINDKQAADFYLDDLPILALGQNTGLHPGDTRKIKMPVANALGDGMTKIVTLSIAKDDPATGDVRYVMTETYDAASMKMLVGETIKDPSLSNVGVAGINTAEVTAVARAQLDVAGGMAHEMRRQSVISFRVPGSNSATSEDELVTVSPAAE